MRRISPLLGIFLASIALIMSCKPNHNSLFQFTSPLPDLSQSITLSTYTGRSIYHNPPDYYAPLFALDYDETMWTIKPSVESSAPRLVLNEDPECFLALRSNQDELLHVEQHQFGTQMWQIGLYPSNHLYYSIKVEQDGANQTEPITLNAVVPKGGQQYQINHCRSLIETILSTFRIIDEPNIETSCFCQIWWG